MVSTELVLLLSDFERGFEVHTDALDRAIGGVLLKEKHLVAFESRKLNDTEQRYSTHEMEIDCYCSLSQNLEALFVGIQVHRQDRQFGGKFLCCTGETYIKTSPLARLLGRV